MAVGGPGLAARGARTGRPRRLPRAVRHAPVANVGLLRHGWADAETISGTDRHWAVVHRTDRGGGGCRAPAGRHAARGSQTARIRRRRGRGRLRRAAGGRAAGAGAGRPGTSLPPGRHLRRRVPGRDAVLLLVLRRGRGAAARRPALGDRGRPGPIRIGQGIEFDYCSVRAAWAIRDLGYDAVVINNNPETVSTDYDACSRLYFEPLDTESVLDVLDHERALTGEPPLVLLTFGGETAIDLARDLAYADVPVAGLSADAIETCEDRERFAALLDELGLEDLAAANDLDELRARSTPSGSRSSSGPRGSLADGGSWSFVTGSTWGAGGRRPRLAPSGGRPRRRRGARCRRHCRWSGMVGARDSRATGPTGRPFGRFPRRARRGRSPCRLRSGLPRPRAGSPWRSASGAS